jgi:hypothetical protein
VVALYLVQAKLAGEELPEVLPVSLIPRKRESEVITGTDHKTKRENGLLKRHNSSLAIGSAIDERPIYKIVRLFTSKDCQSNILFSV